MLSELMLLAPTIFVTIFLLSVAILDIRKRTAYTEELIFGATFGIVYWLAMSVLLHNPLVIIVALLSGLLFAGLGWLLRKAKIFYGGDVYVYGVIGVCLPIGLLFMLKVTALALILSFIFGRLTHKKTLPFLPFVLIAFLFVILLM